MDWCLRRSRSGEEENFVLDAIEVQMVRCDIGSSIVARVVSGMPEVKVFSESFMEGVAINDGC